MTIRFIPARGSTIEQMRAHMMASSFSKLGDCVLVWVNGGDFWSTSPLNIDEEDLERAEYERLKAKFGTAEQTR